HALYKIVGPDGKVTYTDRPPVPPGGKVQSLTPSGAPVSDEALPYELRQVASRYPVTLYTAEKCAPCDSGRNYLRQRGIPFAERTVSTNADIDAMQRVEGGAEIPTLRIGGQQLKGFSDAEWGSYLDAAGYPKQSALPAGYVFPPAQPMVSKDVIPAPAAAPRPAPAPAPAASGGIRF
ncbi:MAG TPA: glutaredoxin family protein, partial [Methylibium sp.]